MGFCGADDTVEPSSLREVSTKHPWVEWGVLFRPELQGTPRYASWEWLDRFREEVTTARADDGSLLMRTAAHLCGDHVSELLVGDAAFASKVHNDYGFNRIQINPTAANGVDSSNLAAGVPGIRACMEALPSVEFIVQVNEETAGLWEPLCGDPPENMAILFDESKGLGKLPEDWPQPYAHIPCGYAGGLGPTNIEGQMRRMAKAAEGRPFWCDCETQVRTVDGERDYFDLDKIQAMVDHAKKLDEEYDLDIITNWGRDGK